ncbi:MAG TPA: TIGR00282 family metallophosphoesterase [Rectinemataceae bacterium]|nr:TIGR00282 family metallophosphoesterase [Rectinemataceae bacterium]
MAKTVKALMIGDVIGQSGLKALFAGLGPLVRSSGADLVVANGENAQAGFGIGKDEVDKFLSMGVQVITSGNHVWEKPGAAELLDGTERLLRPANYPPGAPGKGMVALDVGGATWAVLNLQGRESMYNIDCPFRRADELLARLREESPGALVLVDFHAESVEEKEALAYHLDGRVSAFAGTHTHVQTADERILPKGTGYLTDIGMTGPDDSVIGVKAEICIRRGLSQMPIKMETADTGASISGVLFTIDAESGRCLAVERVRA